MPPAVAETVAAIALVIVLGIAVLAPRRVPEAAVAVPLVAILVALGIVSVHDAGSEIGRLGPTVGFLAAILALAHLADAEGVFAAAGRVVGRSSRGRPVRLLGLVFLVASVVTAALSLDATVVLFTPVVFATAASMRLRARPHVYACTHLANSASLLLPVSNLTSLLAFGATGLSFLRFGALMALPWLAVIAVEYAGFRFFFRSDLRAGGSGAAGPRQTSAGPPVVALIVVGLTLVGFAVTSAAGVEPVWAATAGATALAVRRLARRQITPRRLVMSTNPAFCIFVLALGVVVRGVEDHGLGNLIRRILPDSTGLLALLAVTGIAAVLANLVNNLPAVLVILGAGLGHPGLILAALIGVNVGPNLTYAGSLATLLWRRIARHHDADPSLADFLRLGVLTVPAALVVAVLALWAGLATIGV
ncbi:MAG: ArsB/NhaD family transporter [Mycobacteriales bacterium]